MDIIEFTEEEVQALGVLATFAAKHCGGGEDLIGALLYTGAFRCMERGDPKHDASVVNLAAKLQKALDAACEAHPEYASGWKR